MSSTRSLDLLVCHCHRVCDRTIRDCVREGACSTEDVGAACGAGTSCGGCEPLVEAVVKSELTRVAADGSRLHEHGHRSLTVLNGEEHRAA